LPRPPPRSGYDLGAMTTSGPAPFPDPKGAQPVKETTNGKPPEVAVVVVNYRSGEETVACLKSVFANSGRLQPEVVVVDNCSGDGSAELIRASHPQARVLELPRNAGFSAGVNAGFEATTAEYVCLLNPDAELLPGTLEALVDHMERSPQTAVVAPIVRRPNGRRAPNGYRRFPGPVLVCCDACVLYGWLFAVVPRLDPYVLPAARLEAGVEPAWVSGSVLLARRTAYEAVGPFDEGFFLYFEDLEWQQRLRKSGWKVAVEPRAEAIHRVRGGGAATHVHSPYWVESAVRYLILQGHSFPVAKVAVGLGLALSWWAAAVARLVPFPPLRERAVVQAPAYRQLLGFLLKMERLPEEVSTGAALRAPASRP
jgi:N-acetylglucosaminyl-diphospho-decaprenol L-rhamnosyltransferase